MSTPEPALAVQLANIEKRTGKTLEELRRVVAGCGFEKHGEVRDFLKRELGLGHGDANSLIHHLKQATVPAAASASSSDAVIDEIYAGPKATLRPIHDALMSAIGMDGGPVRRGDHVASAITSGRVRSQDVPHNGWTSIGGTLGHRDVK
jgi:hypothetical protein